MKGPLTDFEKYFDTADSAIAKCLQQQSHVFVFVPLSLSHFITLVDVV